MTNFFLGNAPLFNHILFEILFALSQFIVLRAGVFSVATPGLVAIGAYSSAILHMQYGVPIWLALVVAGVLGIVVGLLLSIPLARLRGIYTAIATIAFIQIVISLNLYFDGVTGGARGINSIPSVVKLWHLALVLAVVLFLLTVSLRSSIGRAFDAFREDEVVAQSLGYSIKKYHRLAFAMSGVIASFAGALYAFQSYSIVPGQFGFGMVETALTAVILGGRASILGPVVGATFLTILPEFSRGFASQRYLVHGALLVALCIYMPDGFVETVRRWIGRLKASRLASTPASVQP
jgi:branched-chain amino acid transport system permease protein